MSEAEFPAMEFQVVEAEPQADSDMHPVEAMPEASEALGENENADDVSAVVMEIPASQPVLSPEAVEEVVEPEVEASPEVLPEEVKGMDMEPPICVDGIPQVSPVKAGKFLAPLFIDDLLHGLQKT